MVSGRGLTREEAESRCIAEAQERYAAIFDDSAALVRATPGEFGEEEIVRRSAVLLISERQFEHADIWNRLVDADHRLPNKLPDAHPINWVSGQSLATGKAAYLPAAHCFLGYPSALAEGFPVPDSNGLASGNSHETAIERSILEVIERDAVSIWWYGRVRRPAMKLDIDRIAIWDQFIAWLKSLHRAFWILDLTHDLAIPVAAAVTCDTRGSDIAFGFAAARTREQAALAAMGELVQFELSKQLSTGRESKSVPDFLAWCQSVKLAEHDFLRPDPRATAPPPRVLEGQESYVEALQSHGLTPYVVGYQTADPGVHVTRAIVPGLRYLWPRFAPGRLYDVAFALGWNTSKMTEAEVNPVPILY